MAQEIYADRGGAAAAAAGAAGAAEAARVWDRCSVVAYFPPELDGTALLSQAASDFGLAGCRLEVEAVRTQDWEQSIRVRSPAGAVVCCLVSRPASHLLFLAEGPSPAPLPPPPAPHPPPCPSRSPLQDSYQPAQVGDGLWIVPVWSAAPPDPAATNIRLEPGLAFGTGDHPTTRLCLRWLQRLQRRGSLGGAALMDYGTGSGVLAVAALLLGCERAVSECRRVPAADGAGLAAALGWLLCCCAGLKTERLERCMLRVLPPAAEDVGAVAATGGHRH